MENDSSFADNIRTLEEQLLSPEVRSSSEELSRLIADDFLEFGSSGKKYDKQQVVESLPHESGVEFTLEDFQVRLLGPGIALATYRAVCTITHSGRSTCSLRSSIWKLAESGWQIVFHQGTPTESK